VVAAICPFSKTELSFYGEVVHANKSM
jgi:hypothetical protein